MEQTLFFECVAAPAIISLAFVFLAIFVSRKANAWGETAAAVILALGWCGAVATTLVLRQEIDWSAPEAWQIVMVPTALTAIAWASLVCCGEQTRELRWIVAAIGFLVTAMLAMPSGEGWSDVVPLHRTWMASIAGASLLNLWSLQKMVQREASGWVLLVALAGLGGPTMLAASAYGGLAEWLLAAIVSTIVFAIATVRWPGVLPSCVLVPVVIFAATATASGRFYTYEEHPVWMYALILFTPTCVSIADRLVANQSNAKRIAFAALVAIILLGVIAFALFGESSQDDLVVQWVMETHVPQGVF